MYIKQSESTAARRVLYFFCADDDSADGFAAKTGLTFSAGDLKLSKAGAVEANHAGTVAEIGGGWYAYTATAGEVDTLGPLLFRTNKTDVYCDGVLALVVAFDPFAATNLGLGHLDAAMSSRLAASAYESPDEVFGYAIHTGYTFLQAIRHMSAMLHGRVNGAGTGREVFRSVVDDADAVVITNDTAGNRTNVQRNG